MGKMATLQENGFKEDTKEYNFWIDKMDKLESMVIEAHHRGLTKNKCSNICKMLNEFKEAEFEFTIGSLDYKALHRFLEIAVEALDFKSISSIVKSHTLSLEINPINYGCKKDDINLIIDSLEDKRRIRK